MEYLKFLLCFIEPAEEQISFPVACDEPSCMPVNNGWKYQVFCCFSNPLEVVWNADEFLHLSEIFGFNFFQWWPELKSLLPEDGR